MPGHQQLQYQLQQSFISFIHDILFYLKTPKLPKNPQFMFEHIAPPRGQRHTRGIVKTLSVNNRWSVNKRWSVNNRECVSCVESVTVEIYCTPCRAI